ncbi:MAG: histidine--tRNA ligase [Proteobacteria bacterium]|nr:histidine--tRNA ligase [Desulfocapsa sp.]MBU3944576.1 histidine--tRNA ligase [Pseudomonadota bacterium]MCG2744633.1 histidine--tRNA ligase [Desulfobacteraceae bacterium]MBU3983194.1 histidine--tRNA ligase [Pseudomonadota bacterium]MBU4029632.1 histidine--tRNA ligase [Pseudomonadota bacterium]
MNIKALNGFKDLLPGEVELWQRLEALARDIFARFNFSEIRLPILEKTDLFSRAIGESTDIVEKEMYTFVDKQVTMRPEATASLLRAYIEHGLHVQKPVQRLFTIGPMFRHERPQKGRLRQFHQMDAEVLGSANPRVDAEMMAMGAMLLGELGLSVSLEMNSLGCPVCRPGFRTSLLAFLDDRHQALCDDCKRRSSTNPLRVLDCKNPKCREQVLDAPSLLEHLCADCADHLSGVQEGLEQLGVQYSLNKFMVRGLDYYTRTTFEFITGDLGAQAAVGAGGRYDGLIEQLGGPRGVPGIGFALGMERLVLLLQQKEAELAASGVDLLVAGLGEQSSRYGFGLTHALRTGGMRVVMDLEGRSLKSQMKQAGKLGVPYVLILGENELAEGKAVLRNMATQEQQEILLQDEATTVATLMLQVNR